MLTSTAALLADPLWNMPLVMPVPLALGPEAARLLGAGADDPDYAVYALDAAPLALPAAVDADTPASTDVHARAHANTALDDMEAAARLSEYHDFDWWRERIARVRAGLQP
jgi:hypothetical protein